MANNIRQIGDDKPNTSQRQPAALAPSLASPSAAFGLVLCLLIEPPLNMPVQRTLILGGSTRRQERRQRHRILATAAIANWSYFETLLLNDVGQE
jgi:hypothetical protein